jgi:hypothetical protein
MPNFWAFLAQELGKIDLKSLKTADLCWMLEQLPRLAGGCYFE